MGAKAIELGSWDKHLLGFECQCVAYAQCFRGIWTILLSINTEASYFLLLLLFVRLLLLT